MSSFFNSCRRCLNPWLVGIILVVIIGLIILFPIIGITGLVVALPIIGCTVMCGAMAIFIGKDKR